MAKHGLTEDNVRYIVQHKELSYETNGALVYCAKLPDGRKAKVRVRNDEIADALTHI